MDAICQAYFLLLMRVSSVPHHAHPLSDQNRCYNGGSCNSMICPTCAMPPIASAALNTKNAVY
jgi:hypothetical protein